VSRQGFCPAVAFADVFVGQRFWVCDIIVDLSLRLNGVTGRIILSEPHLRSYADIGQKAFGPRSLFWISTMFCLELFAIRFVVAVEFIEKLLMIP
jgi:hypothetical protein